MDLLTISACAIGSLVIMDVVAQVRRKLNPRSIDLGSPLRISQPVGSRILGVTKDAIIGQHPNSGLNWISLATTRSKQLVSVDVKAGLRTKLQASPAGLAMLLTNTQDASRRLIGINAKQHMFTADLAPDFGVTAFTINAERDETFDVWMRHDSGLLRRQIVASYPKSTVDTVINCPVPSLSDRTFVLGQHVIWWAHRGSSINVLHHDGATSQWTHKEINGMGTSLIDDVFHCDKSASFLVAYNLPDGNWVDSVTLAPTAQANPWSIQSYRVPKGWTAIGLLNENVAVLQKADKFFCVWDFKHNTRGRMYRIGNGSLQVTGGSIINYRSSACTLIYPHSGCVKAH